jgi:hypothetical protein
MAEEMGSTQPTDYQCADCGERIRFNYHHKKGCSRPDKAGREAMTDHLTRSEMLAALERASARWEKRRGEPTCDVYLPGGEPTIADFIAAELRREPVAATCKVGNPPWDNLLCGNLLPCQLHPAPKDTVDRCGYGGGQTDPGCTNPKPCPQHARGGAFDDEPDPAPVPRGHCGRCDRCENPRPCSDQKDCKYRSLQQLRTHCAGCGAPYQEEAAQGVAFTRPGPPQPTTWTDEEVERIVEDEMRQPPDPTRVVKPSPRAEVERLRARVSELESAHESAPAAIGWNVLEYAPPGALRLTLKQRDDISHELQARARRIAELKMALGDDAGWFDRARAAEQDRAAMRAARDRALAVLDDERGPHVGLVSIARVREALKL